MYILVMSYVQWRPDLQKQKFLPHRQNDTWVPISCYLDWRYLDMWLGAGLISYKLQPSAGGV